MREQTLAVQRDQARFVVDMASIVKGVYPLDLHANRTVPGQSATALHWASAKGVRSADGTAVRPSDFLLYTLESSIKSSNRFSGLAGL